MAKRLAGTRALVHVLRPNKTKPAGRIKRARKTGRKLGTARRHKTRTVFRLTAKGGKLAGGGVVRAAQALPPRTRRTIVVRTAGGRFNGSRRV